jgi:hypothetical protein
MTVRGDFSPFPAPAASGTRGSDVSLNRSERPLASARLRTREALPQEMRYRDGDAILMARGV